MRRAILGLTLIGAAMLSACAGGDRGGLVDRLAGAGRLEGDADHVTIHGASSRLDALPLAVGHCGHYGKSAEYADRHGDDFVFRCVKAG